MTSAISTTESSSALAVPRFTVWVQTPTGTRRFDNVLEAAAFPHWIDVTHDYTEQTTGSIVRVRQVGLDADGPRGGHRLLVYPDGEIPDAVDAICLPTGVVRAADASGEQHEFDGHIAWLNPERQ